MSTPDEPARKSQPNWLLPLAGVAAVVLAAGLYWSQTRQPAGPPATTVAVTSPASETAAGVPDFPLAELLVPGPLPDNVLGNAKAPVTIVEYASMTCPHCANFHTTTFKELKTKYIDTGKAKLIFREFPLDNLAASVSLLSRCVEPSKFFGFIGVMFENQQVWAYGEGDPRPRLLVLAKQAGFTEESFNKCITDQAMLDKVVAVRQRADDVFKVGSTPTFFINGHLLKGGGDLAEFETLMAPYLPK